MKNAAGEIPYSTIGQVASFGNPGMPSEVERLKQGVLDMIRDRLILPGQRLDQRRLAKHFDSSTAPLREALSSLESEGFLVRQQGLGVFCRVHTVPELEEMVEIRGILEALAARRATSHVTEENIAELRGMAQELAKPIPVGGDRQFVENHIRFHKRVVQISRSPRLQSLLEFHHFIDEILANVSSSLWKVEPHDHLSLVEALASRNPDWAEQAMRNHIAPTYQKRFVALRARFGEGPIILPLQTAEP